MIKAPREKDSTNEGAKDSPQIPGSQRGIAKKGALKDEAQCIQQNHGPPAVAKPLYSTWIRVSFQLVLSSHGLTKCPGL